MESSSEVPALRAVLLVRPVSLTAKWTKWSGDTVDLELLEWPTFEAEHVIFRLADGRTLVERSVNVVRLEFPNA